MKKYIFAILSLVLSSGQYRAMEDPIEPLLFGAQLEPLNMDELYAVPDGLEDLTPANLVPIERDMTIRDSTVIDGSLGTDPLKQFLDTLMSESPASEPFNPFAIADSIRFAREVAATTMTTIASEEPASQEIEPVTQQDPLALTAAIRTGSSKGMQCYCPVCLQQLTSLKKLSQHIKDDHPLSTESFACPKCPKKFQFPQQLNSHIDIVHPKRLLQCTRCESICKSKPALKQHMKDFHDGQVKTKFTCSMCSKEYIFERGLKLHMKKHQQTPPNPDTEQSPSDQFNSSPEEDARDFVDHVLDVSAALGTSREEPPSKRRRALASIALAQDYTELATNNDEPLTDNPLSCPQCPKKFPRPNKLQQHITIVHPATLLQCTQCDSTCKSQQSLTRHIKETHEGTAQIFPCSTCTSKFSRERLLKYHMKKKHSAAEKS